MVSKRAPIHPERNSPNMNFRFKETPRNEVRGTRPTATPTTVPEVILKMILYACKKTIFFDTNLKVGIYLGALFLISLIGDFIPFPKTYFARSNNIFNLYFVKLGWGWTLSLSIPFLIMTSYTLCCGDMKRILRNHLPRIGIATMFWYFWTSSFYYIETNYGRCNIKGFPTKSVCLKNGHFWNGFDLSGHAFILIYSSLVLIEEARPINYWDNIREYLRNEEHNRQNSVSEHSNPLKKLNENEINNLKCLYNKYSTVIRVLFIGMTCLQILWDVMLVCTMLYYHKMIEKVVSGIIAILTWYFTYRYWYVQLKILPDPPGKGIFTYQKDRKTGASNIRRSSSLLNSQNKSAQPTFMGMPIYTRQSQTENVGSTSGTNVGLS